MAIATLIAAGRLDDRLVDRALGLLRELDPKAAFRHWIDEGDAADLRFTGDVKAARWALDGARGRRRRRPARRAALEAAARRRHGFDRSSARNASTSSPIMPASRTRSRGSPSGRCRASSISAARCASGCGCLPGSTSASSAAASTSGSQVTAGAETLVQTMRAGGASCLLVSGGFLSFAEPVARTRRLRPGQGQPAGLRRRQAERRGRRPDRRCAWPSARRWSRRASELGLWRERTCSRSATAPTTS